jgi:hypothetical protein
MGGTVAGALAVVGGSRSASPLVAAFGGCSTCHDAEARAFLAHLRGILAGDAGV